MDDRYRITIYEKLKQTKFGRHLEPIDLGSIIRFRINAAIIDPKQLCKEHLNLLLSYVKPSKHVSKDTIFRWIKQVLEAAGIDVKKYSAHSRKAAFTSSCKARGLNFKPRL